MIFYYSGSGGHTKQGRPHKEPEQLLRKPDLMLSYYLIRSKYQNQDKRMPLLAAAKRKR